MKNAHQRFGTLEFTKRTRDTTTHIRVHLDRAVLETDKNERGQARAHLISMIGGDSEVGALWAALIEVAFFQIHLPGGAAVTASLGPEPQCFRGSVILPGRKHPVRHLVALSAEMLKTRPGTDRNGNRTVLCNDDPVFVLYRVGRRFGLPVVPEWAPWFMRELERLKAIQPLLGLGCSPVLVKGNKDAFLCWIGKALKAGSIRIPEQTGAMTWKLGKNFLEESPLSFAKIPKLQPSAATKEAIEEGVCESS